MGTLTDSSLQVHQTSLKQTEQCFDPTAVEITQWMTYLEISVFLLCWMQLCFCSTLRITSLLEGRCQAMLVENGSHAPFKPRYSFKANWPVRSDWKQEKGTITACFRTHWKCFCWPSLRKITLNDLQLNASCVNISFFPRIFKLKAEGFHVTLINAVCEIPIKCLNSYALLGCIYLMKIQE